MVNSREAGNFFQFLISQKTFFIFFKNGQKTGALFFENAFFDPQSG